MGARLAPDALLDVAFRAVFEPELWADLAIRLRDALRSDSTAMLHTDRQQLLVGNIAAVGKDPHWTKQYMGHYFQVDERIAIKRRLGRRCPVLTDEMLASRGVLKRSELYNDFLLPQKRPHFIGAGAHFWTGDHYASVGAQRSARHGPYDADEIRYLEYMGPHVARAVQLFLQAGHLCARTRMIEAALDEISSGTILIDRQGRPLHTNRRADRILREGAGLLSLGGTIRAERPREDARLQHLLWDIVEGGRGGGVSVTSARSDRILRVVAAPIRGVEHLLDSATARAVLFIMDSDGDNAPPPGLLRNLFHFTPAEARTAAKLAGGWSVGQIASDFAITEDAVRKALKSMYRKTGTERQGELIAVILTSTIAR